MTTKRAPKRRSTRAAGSGASSRGGARRPGKPRKAPRARRSRPRAEQPLGVGQGDAFAVQRLMPRPPPRRHSALREIGWAEFGALAGALAERVAIEFAPDVVLGIANAGVFVGGALAPALHAELLHLHLPGRNRERERLPPLSGRKVLVVDDAADTGRTLEAAAKLARRAGAAEVRTAVIVLRPGGARPDFHALRTAEVTVFGWDYQMHAAPPDVDPGDAGV